MEVIYNKKNNRYAIIDGRARFRIGMEEGIRKFPCIVIVERVNIKHVERCSEK